MSADGAPPVEEYWQACAEGRLVIPECTACGARFFVPEPLCPQCGSASWRYTPSPGTGHVYSFSVVHRPPSPLWTEPYVLAAVQLAEGATVLSNIVRCEPAEVFIGMPVAVCFEARSRFGIEVLAPVFEPSRPRSEERGP